MVWRLTVQCWGGRKGNSDERGRFLSAARTDGTQRWGHMGLFWEKAESPNLNGDSKTPNQTCRANKCKHRLKRTAVSELRRQSLMLGGTLEQPFSNQSSYLLAKTRAAISFIRDVDFQWAMAVLSLLLLSFFRSHFPKIPLLFLHHNPIAYHLLRPPLEE